MRMGYRAAPVASAAGRRTVELSDEEGSTTKGVGNWGIPPVSDFCCRFLHVGRLSIGRSNTTCVNAFLLAAERRRAGRPSPPDSDERTGPRRFRPEVRATRRIGYTDPYVSVAGAGQSPDGAVRPVATKRRWHQMRKRRNGETSLAWHGF